MGEAQATHSGLASLPQDVLRNIVAHIEYEDLATLRLTCSSLAYVATEILFHRISISKLWRDRESFIAICDSPHLARHVREVEWQELSWYPDSFRYLPKCGCEEDTMDIGQKIDSLCEDLFWLPSLCHSYPNLDGNRAEEQRQAAIRDFQAEFPDLISRLPRLHNIISQPMRTDRVLHWCEYPIDVKHFRSQHAHSMSKNLLANCKLQSNDGLILFLLPAIASLKLPIDSLLWEDEYPGSSYWRSTSLEALQHLTSLSLSFHIDSMASTSENLFRNPDSFISQHSARNVRHLSISLSSHPHELLTELQHTLLRYSPQTKITQWARLSSLSLTAIIAVKDILFDIVSTNAATLQFLYLENCLVTYETISGLMDIAELHLKSLRIEDDVAQTDLYEKTLLQWLNTKDRLRPEGLVASGSIHRADPVRTVQTVDINDCDLESIASETSSECSMTARLRTAPKWVWSRYFHHASSYGEVYCHIVPDSPDYKDAHTTNHWKFTSRNGEVALGTDPYEFFEKWDTDKGDAEEPTPLCHNLAVFMGIRNPPLGDILGTWKKSPAYELLRRIKPPEGAVHVNSRTYDGIEDWRQSVLLQRL